MLIVANNKTLSVSCLGFSINQFQFYPSYFMPGAFHEVPIKMTFHSYFTSENAMHFRRSSNDVFMPAKESEIANFNAILYFSRMYSGNGIIADETALT